MNPTAQIRFVSCTRVVVLACALLTGIAACTDKDSPPINRALIAANAPDEESRNATIVFADSSWTKARLQVGRARKFYGRGETLLDSGVYVEFYASDGSLNATLVCDSALVDDRTMNMIAYGNVHVESDGGQRIIDTDRLKYDHVEQRVHSDARVSIIDNIKGQTLRGVGFTSNLALTRYEIYNISGTMKPNQ
ncbi:MAG: LPS export ABC transporter periplasmic protein LptC [bacterium]|nr:LPS export ABC transporter periplasmic protein LptC [Candidatus Kapabacteria bacterium]